MKFYEINSLSIYEMKCFFFLCKHLGLFKHFYKLIILFIIILNVRL